MLYGTSQTTLLLEIQYVSQKARATAGGREASTFNHRALLLPLLLLLPAMV
jgi:hypothetical protein